MGRGGCLSGRGALAPPFGLPWSPSTPWLAGECGAHHPTPKKPPAAPRSPTAAAAAARAPGDPTGAAPRRAPTSRHAPHRASTRRTARRTRRKRPLPARPAGPTPPTARRASRAPQTTPPAATTPPARCTRRTPRARRPAATLLARCRRPCPPKCRGRRGSELGGAMRAITPSPRRLWLPPLISLPRWLKPPLLATQTDDAAATPPRQSLSPLRSAACCVFPQPLNLTQRKQAATL